MIKAITYGTYKRVYLKQKKPGLKIIIVSPKKHQRRKGGQLKIEYNSKEQPGD